jgi:hypothetical protein
MWTVQQTVLPMYITPYINIAEFYLNLSIQTNFVKNFTLADNVYEDLYTCTSAHTSAVIGSIFTTVKNVPNPS